jgi:DNA-binding PadR family transcriptional regulator
VSSTRLLVLGAVRIFQPVHGYLVRQELVSWNVEEWANIKPGSIYSALRTLARERNLEEAGSDAQGGRPARTTYRITLDGNKEYFMLLRQALWSVDLNDPSLLLAGLSFMSTLPRDEVIAAMEARSSRLVGMVKATEHALRHLDEHHDAPAHVAEHLHLRAARTAAEREFTLALAERLRAGYYRFTPEEGWDAGPGPEGFPSGKPA